MEIPLLKDIVIIFGLAVAVLWLCTWLRLPSIVGFLLTGIISGPNGLALIKDAANVDILAQIGIILLLFTVGLEFSLKRMHNIKKFFLLAGTLQVAMTVLAGVLIGRWLNRPLGDSLFLGFLLSMSSTAIVLKVLEQRDEINTPQGHLSLGILIFQDIVAIPMILLTPLFGGEGITLDQAFVFPLLFDLTIIPLVFFAATQVVPTLLHYIVQAGNRDLIMLSGLTLCFAVAWLSSSLGLSLAVGAFLAGLLIADSDYRHDIIGTVFPLREVFLCLFFISIGMKLESAFILQYPFLILFSALGVICLKFSIIALATIMIGLPLRMMLITGLALSQIGEFSYVLVKIGADHGLGSPFLFQLFLAVSFLTMTLTPFLIAFSHSITHFFQQWPQWQSKTTPNEDLHKHIIIIGFGFAGKTLAAACKAMGLAYVVVEINPHRMHAGKHSEEPMYFGDASQESVLRRVHIGNASLVAVMINDKHATAHIARLAHKLNPQAYLVVRTRYINEIPEILQLGAHEVIADEVGSSVEMVTHILKKCNVPQNLLDDAIKKALVVAAS